MALETLTTISPITNKPILTRAGLSDDDISSLRSNAVEAFHAWRQVPFPKRLETVKKAIKALGSKEDTLAKELTEQMGRPIAYTGKEIQTAVARGEYICSVSSDVLKDTPGTAEKGFQRFIRKLPVGPVLIIFAWNYPYLILVNSLLPALLAGNSVILKPSPQTPTIVEHIAEIFIEAGVPKGVIQYFHSGLPVQVEALIRSPEVKHVCFTGSVAGGLSVKNSASGRVDLAVGLELGGKDPAYVRSDVDIKWAAEEIVDGAVFNSGQSCCSIERVYVAEDVHDQFVAAVQEVLKGYVLGDPLDKKTHLGPVVSKRSVEIIKSHIQDAINKGAEDVTPRNSSFESPPQDGNFVAPVILVNVNHDMVVMKEETFGPVIPIMKVEDDQKATYLMNDSNFGLTASIWTKDIARAKELMDDIESGTVFVNRCDYPSPDLAWTGWKDSGKGQTLSQFGFDQFIKLKSYHIKEYPM